MKRWQYYTKGQKAVDALCMLVILATFTLVLVRWQHLPDTIPTHYGFTGEADAWGGKGQIWFTPCAGLAIYGLISFVERFPHAMNTPFTVTETNKAFIEGMSRWLIVNMKLFMVCIIFYLTLISVMLWPISGWFTVAVVVVIPGLIIQNLVHTARGLKKHRD